MNFAKHYDYLYICEYRVRRLFVPLRYTIKTMAIVHPYKGYLNTNFYIYANGTVNVE